MGKSSMHYEFEKKEKWKGIEVEIEGALDYKIQIHLFQIKVVEE
jgi:outer membrane receptor for ferric coprogen and ferric-rhodotorulic acid